MLPGVRTVWVSRYMRVALGLARAASKGQLTKPQQNQSTASAGRSTDPLFAPQKSGGSLARVESGVRSAGDGASRTASSGVSASGDSKRSSRTGATLLLVLACRGRVDMGDGRGRVDMGCVCTRGCWCCERIDN